MKKFITAFATLALLTSATPVFAQEGQQLAPVTNVASTKKASDKQAVKPFAEFVTINLYWNQPPTATRFEVIVTNVTDGYVLEKSRQTSTEYSARSLRVGNHYSIMVRALDQFGNQVGQSWYKDFEAKQNDNWRFWF
ncbi:hypothetical protein HPY28_10745 [Brevibacillus sp. HB1.2]|uniref:hypothetical protein n=1 Tax=Brevibacillus sp. HB1.2 TaxID=2738807 RepID=UPI00035DC384|nr:hypothetical protein [Brevibacillus sp. HB1.2]ATF12490.1 hypothetical protein A616_10920 [Brevibacillus brevis X23]NTU20792.1 hypothetical protein [Brevibacillus sp. HB1.2]